MNRTTVLGDTASEAPIPTTVDGPFLTRRWNPATQRRAVAVAAIGLAAALAVSLQLTLAASVAGLWLTALTALAAVAGSLTGRHGDPASAAPPLLTAGLTGALACWSLTEAAQGSAFALAAGVAATSAGTLLLLGRFSALGWRAGRAGALAVLGTVLLWELIATLIPRVHTPRGQSDLGTATLLLSVLALGLLPRFALGRAGLTGPDERRSGAASTGPRRADAARAAAHREYAPATVVGTLSAVAGGWLAVREPDVWTVSLVALLALVLCARAWAYPLVVEVIALMTATVVLLLRLVVLGIDTVDGTPYGPLLGLAALAAPPFALLTLGPPRPLRQQVLRRMMSRVETAGTVALLPLALGAFGCYAPLLTAF